MLFVAKAGSAISEGTAQVVQAVATASQTLQSEIEGGIAQATEAVESVGSQVTSVVEQVAQLPSKLNPQALAQPLVDAVQQAQEGKATSATVQALAMT